MRIMGIDLGSKTIGLAVSDQMGLTAQPVTTLRRKAVQDDVEDVVKAALQLDVEFIVIGMPVNMNGTEGPAAGQTRKFAERLKAATTLPIEFWDERLSTAAVTRVLIDADVSRVKRKESVDKLAAAYILQGYLDRQARIREQ
ncbi:MAG: Holliday junction DNA helicase RuvA [Deltaproteobacteria bacterium RIFCSPLOWO2_02_FULL_53_8]|nr:MAG: Holliday junction DNA helicase RuvA [Deltaproteobacteria bacterium RIFCSPLOWO2_02_FULL_53_8]